MRTLPLTNRGLHLPTIVMLGLLTVLAALLASASAASARGGAPDTPGRPVGTAVFVGGVDLEWNDVPGADSYEVQLFWNGQWTDLPGDGIEIAFYGAGAIISELDPTSSLWFHVRARNAHGSSDWSDFNFMSPTNQHALGRRARPDNVVASGAPVINGTARVGETLSAETTGIEDGNGLDRVQFLFQWVSSDGSPDADIAGGTDSTYTLAADDEGRTIRVRVAFNDRGGYAESLTGEGTGQVTSSGQANPVSTPEPAQNSPATGSLVITGTAEVGETLTADTSGIADADGLSGATFSHQWVSNDGASDTDITGATDSTYTLVAAEVGMTIKVRVSFTDDAGFEESMTSTATEAVSATEPDEPPARPRGLTGTVAHDAVTLTWNDPGDLTITGFQILRRDRALLGRGNFQIHVDDTGSALAAYIDRDVSSEGSYVYRIKALNAAGLSERSSYFRADTPSAPAQNSPASGQPTITGTAQVGETLSVDTSGITDANGLSGATFSHRWVANDGTSDTDIAGATDSIYTLVAADEGMTIKVRVSFTDDAGFEESLTSDATAVVLARPNSSATGAPAITGTAEVGETLGVDTSGITDANGLTNAQFAHQWIRKSSSTDADIAGATGATYTLTSADIGSALKVRVSFTDDDGNSEALTSEPLAVDAVTEETTEWSATLTVGAHDSAVPPIVGYSLWGDDFGELSTSTFEIDDRWYRPLTLVNYAGALLLNVSSALPRDFTLTIDGRNFEATDSAIPSSPAHGRYWWESGNLDWLAGDTVDVSVTLKQGSASLNGRELAPPTAYFMQIPDEHDGTNPFTIRLQFTETLLINETTLLDNSLQVSNGTVTNFSRVTAGSNVAWFIQLQPDSTVEVTVELAGGLNCNLPAAICADDGRKLFNDLEVTIPAPPLSQLSALRTWLATPAEDRPDGILEDGVDYGNLSSDEAQTAIQLLWDDLVANQKEERCYELDHDSTAAAGKTLRVFERVFGSDPGDGHSLWIAMHGGGGVSPQSNDSHWSSMADRYEPDEGIYVAPRAPTDTWNLWHQGHIDPLFHRLIENYVICRDVNPDLVYLLGYSAGGDGVYQLAPRMADRWAAAATIAGHPNDASPVGLRNIGFGIFMGALDSSYNRNGKAAEWKELLEDLQAVDPTGYSHWVRFYPVRGHYIVSESKEALPWMKNIVRNPWPDRIEWQQDNITNNRFYWLAVPPGVAEKNQKVSARVEEQIVHIQASGLANQELFLRLSDNLIDLDAAISVWVNNQPVHEGVVHRSVEVIRHSLQERADPASIATSEISLTVGP